MPSMTDVRAVAANAVVENVLAGKIYEFASANSIASLLATASAVGLRISFIIGNEVQLDDQEISAANRFPLMPDDFLTRGGALKGDRIVIRLRNTTVGAINAFTKLDLEPIG